MARRGVVEDHKPKIEQITERLLDKQTMSAEEVRAVLTPQPC
jgi:ATP-dependent Zn protease